jgi:hypothetical protein
MKIRGLVFLFAAFPLGALYTRAFHNIQIGPFGDEFGSVAFPVPPQLEALRLGAQVCAIVGLSLLVTDFIKWRRHRLRD